MGMLAYFVDVFNRNNALTPEPLLLLFITSVLALAWAVFTLFSYHRSSANARFVALVDLAIFGTLIAAVYLLRFINDAQCVAAPARPWYAAVGAPSDLGWGPPDKPCAMLKACFGLGILNVILFFVTALAAFSHGDHLSAYDGRRSHRSSSAHHHHHHRHHGSRSPRSQGGRSRSGHSSYRSSHSRTRRVYV